MAVFIINLQSCVDYKEKQRTIESIIFCIFRKVFFVEDEIDVKIIYRDVSRYYDKKWSSIAGYLTIDCEAEFCALYLDEFVMTKKLMLVKTRFEQNKNNG